MIKTVLDRINKEQGIEWRLEKSSKGDILDVEKAVIILYGENNCQKKIPDFV